MPVGIVEIVAQVPPEPPAQGAMGAEVTVKVDGRSYRTMLLSFRIGRLRPVLVAARALDSKAALGPGDWRVDRRSSTEIPATALSAIADGGDLEAAQPIREGEILTHGLVRRRLAVKRGDIVTLVVEGPGFRITTQGLAMTDARRGDSLRVMNPTSKREALGKVEASGIVRVPFHGSEERPMRTLREAVTALVVLASLAVPIGAGAQSLYRDGATAGLLYVDHRARAVNDIVTIVIVEQAASSVTANTKTEKESTRTRRDHRVPDDLRRAGGGHRQAAREGIARAATSRPARAPRRTCA